MFCIIEILLWIFLPVCIGYLTWQVWLKHKSGGEKIAAVLAKRLNIFVMLIVISPLMVIIFWQAPWEPGQTLLLAAMGLGGLLLGGASAFTIARLNRLEPNVCAAWFLCGSHSNMFSFGSITVLFLLGAHSVKAGEEAIAILVTYRIFEAPFYFMIGWPLAAVIHQAGDKASGTWWDIFKKSFRPVTLLPLLCIAGGCILNSYGPVRPDALLGITDPLIKVNACILGLAVGLTIRSAAPGKHFKAGMMVSFVKFVLSPLAMIGLAWLLGFRGITLQVIGICSAMPVAFLAVTGANLLNLNEELVGSIWLITTLGLFLVIPALVVLLPYLS